MLHIQTEHYDKFHCIADKCPKTCCQGWQIMIDEESLRKYRNETDPEVAACVARGVDFREECVRMTEAGCAMLAPNGLCRLVLAKGEDYIPYTCHMYPRHMEEFENVREWSLSLSCPEAARMMLSQVEPLTFETRKTDETDDPEEYEDVDPEFYANLVEARKAIYGIIQDRSLPFREKARLLAMLAAELQDCVDMGLLRGMADVLAEIPEMQEELHRRLSDGAAAPDLSELMDRDPLDRTLFEKMFELEVLDGEHWPETIRKTKKHWQEGLELRLTQEQELQAEQILMFWIYTYFCGAVYDGMLFAKTMLAVCSTYWIFQVDAANAFPHGLTEAAWLFAREIEHSDENLNALAVWFDPYGLEDAE